MVHFTFSIKAYTMKILHLPHTSTGVVYTVQAYQWFSIFCGLAAQCPKECDTLNV